VPDRYEPWQDLKPLEPTEKQMWMLGVSDQELAFRDVLMQVTSHMVGTALRTPIGAGYYERMSNPRVGDLVMEYTRGWWSHDPRVRAWSFGVLVAAREELDVEGPVAYVRWGRNKDDVQRWANSKFVLVPIERENFGV
jgi:hypothetical protein